MTGTDPGSGAGLSEYEVGFLIAILITTVSIGIAVSLSVEPYLQLHRVTSALWAWAIGAATGMWVVPWASQAIGGGSG